MECQKDMRLIQLKPDSEYVRVVSTEMEGGQQM